MGLIFLIFSAIFPRVGTLLIWIARPALFSLAFAGSWLIPVLGIIFLPFTTLMYVILWSPGVGLTGFDWFWIFLALLIDIASYGGGYYANRGTTATSTR